MPNPKPIYSGIPELIKRLSSLNAVDAASHKLFLFHQIDTEGKSDEQIWQELAWALIKAHVPAFRQETRGRKSTQDKKVEPRVNLYAMIEAMNNPSYTVRYRELAKKWSKAPHKNPYGKNLKASFIKEEFEAAREVVRKIVQIEKRCWQDDHRNHLDQDL